MLDPPSDGGNLSSSRSMNERFQQFAFAAEGPGVSHYWLVGGVTMWRITLLTYLIASGCSLDPCAGLTGDAAAVCYGKEAPEEAEEESPPDWTMPSRMTRGSRATMANGGRVRTKT